MAEKVLITGANGLLGQKLVNILCGNRNHEVFALSRGENRNNTKKGYTYLDLDLTDFDKLTQIIHNIEPTIIINAAAMTNVDECEEKKEECDLINVELVRRLVKLCEKYHSYLVHISTDFIFDGENGPYKEDDEPNPLNYYGLSKLKSEKIIEDSSLKYAILRTVLVYGEVDNMSRSNLVLWVKESVENKKIVTIIDDQFRMPTFADDLAQACLSAIKKKVEGVYNVSSCELLSIYDIAIEIVKTFNLDTSYVKRISTQELNQKAKRPAITGFDLTKSHKTLDLPLVTFTERLQVFKNQLSTIK